MAHRGQTMRAQHYWPGFVDALAALLVVVIFLLVVFVLAQVFLSQALSGRDKALEALNAQVVELAELLSLEKKTNDGLRINISELSASLDKSNKEKDSLLLKLSDTSEQLEKANQTALSDREQIRIQLAEVEKLQRDISALTEVRKKLETRVLQLTSTLNRSEEKTAQLLMQSTTLEQVIEDTHALVGQMRDRSLALEGRLEDQENRTLLAQSEIKEREIRLQRLQRLYLASQSDLKQKETISQQSQARVGTLSAQIAALRAQLEALQTSLDEAEEKDRKQRIVISDLGQRLNQALARKVQELSRYRSEFFGRLREVLGDRQDVQIVGDRFVFQSEVLFASGSAELGEAGKNRLSDLAKTLGEIIPGIPKDINWVLRVDGHTDSRPINTTLFPSNWELSTARATNVAKFLIRVGIPPQNIAATGFAEYQPIDSGNDEIAYRRNRRIEFKLTER